MKKLLLASAITLFVVFSVQAAELQQYTSLKTNYTSMRNTFKNMEGKRKLNKRVYGGSLAYGLKFGDVRTELEGNINKAARKRLAYEDVKTKIHADSVMLNGYYDIPTGIALRPYIGAGIGIARVRGIFKWIPEYEEDPGKFKMSGNKLAYQLAGGATYELTQNWNIDAEYRHAYFGTISKTDEYGKSTLSVKTHNFYLGLRYTF